MEKTVIVRIRKGKNNNSTDDKVHSNSTYQLSGNYLIIIELGNEKEIPNVNIPYNLGNVISWSTRKNKNKSNK